LDDYVKTEEDELPKNVKIKKKEETWSDITPHHQETE
jgi:hypothetical protein